LESGQWDEGSWQFRETLSGKKYGKLLGLLDIEVQTSLITAFAQYYDPPVRAFKFQDFQLVPTLKEFE